MSGDTDRLAAFAAVLILGIGGAALLIAMIAYMAGEARRSGRAMLGGLIGVVVLLSLGFVGGGSALVSGGHLWAGTLVGSVPALLFVAVLAMLAIGVG